MEYSDKVLIKVSNKVRQDIFFKLITYMKGHMCHICLSAKHISMANLYKTNVTII